MRLKLSAGDSVSKGKKGTSERQQAYLNPLEWVKNH